MTATAVLLGTAVLVLAVLRVAPLFVRQDHDDPAARRRLLAELERHG